MERTQTRYTTLEAARADGWVTVGQAVQEYGARGRGLTTIAGQSFGFKLSCILRPGAVELPTHTLTLTDEVNRTGRPGAYVSAIRRTTLHEKLDAIYATGSGA